MQIRNISYHIKDLIPSKYNIIEGSSIYGKIVTDEQGNNFIKLYNGTTIPVNLLNENAIEKNKFTKFIVEKIDNNSLILRVLGIENTFDIDALDSILLKLNVPLDTGKEIINYLLLYNIPATDENILRIYKNIRFINILNKTDKETLIQILKNYFNENIPHEETFNKLASDILNKISSTKPSQFVFLLQNHSEINVDNIINLYNFLYENNINDFIEMASKLNGVNKKILSLNDLLDTDKENLPIELHDKLKNIILIKDIIKDINMNYNFYFFNEKINDQLFKNSIVVKKNKIEKNEYAKLFLSVETSNIGKIEAYILKNNRIFTVDLKVTKDYLPLLKDNLYLLEISLKKKMKIPVKLSVDELINEEYTLKLNKFFNDNKFSSLDVIV
ncbi:hypothetical protein ABG79_00134 [Caloramator mitchellensis]|uniref:Flagellar hook-length control protein FliK n=1 Tax=Caloramator mitchellensis TaxID=908809 RepID=A0A0R3JWQ9_CALMK|nr:hypothetical protein [Caloramator mitchellensis]KRQ87969.1 hypothetical protein ABG79_00134 [Caloramator mitchellensis]